MRLRRSSRHCWFFNIDDRYDILVDTLTKRTLRFESNIREGDYTFRSHYRYDWDSLRVHTWAQSRQTEPRVKTMPLTERSMDPVSLYFNLRSIDPDTLVEGRRYDLEMVLEDTIKVLKFRLVGREVCRVPNKGKFRTFIWPARSAQARASRLRMARSLIYG